MEKPLFAKTVIVLIALGLITTASAAVSEPEAFTNYLDVFFSMLKGTGGNLAMALIAGFSGLKAWQNGNATPVIWGALAIFLIAASPYMATSLTDNVSTYIDLAP